VDGVDFEVHRRETVCIVGESGCGKTVTALAILGLLRQPPARVAGGRVLFDGQNLLEMEPSAFRKLRGRRIGMVFQEPMTSLNPVFTIGDQVSEAILTHMNRTEVQARQQAIELLDDVGIKDPETAPG
jgi:peptide/nickel transport system ATP-binding protein